MWITWLGINLITVADIKPLLINPLKGLEVQSGALRSSDSVLGHIPAPAVPCPCHQHSLEVAGMSLGKVEEWRKRRKELVNTRAACKHPAVPAE